MASDTETGKCIYEIRVAGQISKEWSAWFEGMEINQAVGETEGTFITMISGSLVDQSALHGVLNKIRDLNLTILSCVRKA